MKDAYSISIWTCYANIWLGFWLLFTHIALGYGGALAGNDLVCGLLLIVFGACSISQSRIWAPWAVCMVGIWLQFAPLVFWASSPAAYLNDTLIGCLAIVCSILIPGISGKTPDTGPSIPPGWSYNPSSWPQRLPILILGTVGWFISRYLAAHQFGFIDTAWDPFFGDGTLRVITSDISQAFPIPDAGLGAMAYTLEVLLALKGGERRWRSMPWMVLLFGLLVIPLGLISILLIILQPLVVGFWCSLCLFTALCMMAMIAFTVDEVAAVLQFLTLHRRERKPFWDVFWRGDDCPMALTDTRTPSLGSPLKSVLAAACWGVTVPWNLLLSLLIGTLLMLAPWLFHLSGILADSDHVVGALTAVVSVLSMAESIRAARYGNLALGAWILLSCLWFKSPLTSTLFHCASGAFLIACSFRKGPIRERSGTAK